MGRLLLAFLAARRAGGGLVAWPCTGSTSLPLMPSLVGVQENCWLVAQSSHVLHVQRFMYK